MNPNDGSRLRYNPHWFTLHVSEYDRLPFKKKMELSKRNPNRLGSNPYSAYKESSLRLAYSK